jgi:hypothetical protein
MDKFIRVPAAVKMRTTINRYWIGHLTAYEFTVLTFIYERTYPYGKDAERIPFRHFLKGVYSSGELLHAPVNMSRASLVRSLSAMRKKGMLVKEGAGWETAVYGINPAWTPVLSHSKYVAPTDQEPCSLRADARAPTDPSITRDTNLGKEEGIITAGSSAPAELLDRLKGALAKTDAPRQFRLDKGGVSAWRLAWEAAFRNFHPQWPKPPEWVKADQAILKRSFARYQGIDRKFDGVDLITWVIENWHTVHNQVPQLQASGLMPKLRPFVRHIELIYDLYMTHTGAVTTTGGRVLTKPAKVIETLQAENAALQATVKRLATAPQETTPRQPPPRVPANSSPIHGPQLANKPLATRTGHAGWDKPAPRKSGLRRRIKP